MHAVVVTITRNDIEKSVAMLRSEVVPRVSKAPGFVAGYWTAKESSGLAMILFESEDAAGKAAEMVRSNAPDSVTIDDVEVREVVASA